ncbi:MAG: DMT family transporter [Clostridiales Family XIII bacterium]|nr:DMT family transporter [Clostridiales Family XIII bacterium]
METKTKGFLFIILASLCYGVMPALTQTGYKLGLTVPTVLAGRYIFGTLMIFIFIFIRKKNLKIGKVNIFLLMLVGIDVFVCVNFMSLSYKYVPGAVTSLLTFLYIVIVNIFMILLGREKLTKLRVICLILAILGLTLVVYTPGGKIFFDIRGILFGIGAGVLYAVWAISMGAKRFDKYSPEVVMAFMLIIPTLSNIISCIVNNYPVFPENFYQWVIVILLALTPGFIAPVAFCAGVKMIGAGTASLINTSEPVIVYIVGMVFMGDKMTTSATFGGILIVLGLILLHFNEMKNKV